MNTSQSIKLLAAALKKAQSEMGGVEMNQTNPFYKSRYADLGAVIKVSKEALAANGLSISQPTVTNEYGVGVTTLLLHESGEFIESTITLPITDTKNIAQEAGKIITYLRRYSLASILNLYSDEDTDGEGKKSEQKKAQPKSNKAMTIEEAMNVTGGKDNRKYGDCTTEELEGKRLGIVKVLNDKTTPQDKLDAYIWKLEAIKIILAERVKK
jgi:hypothetical protein